MSREACVPFLAARIQASIHRREASLGFELRHVGCGASNATILANVAFICVGIELKIWILNSNKASRFLPATEATEHLSLANIEAGIGTL